MTDAAAGSSPDSPLTRLLGVRRNEMQAVAWSFLYFFALLASYYMLRSVRETMAIVSGVGNIPWLYTGTFTVMLVATPVFGWVASRFPRKVFLPWVYYFFIANIAIFYLAFTLTEPVGASRAWVARAFFVWLSVFNLFVVAVFWSFMADIYTKEQSRRLFGVISAGGSAGAFLGPLATSELVVRIGFENLLPLSAGLLVVAVACVFRLRAWAMANEVGAQLAAVASDKALGGSALAGVRFTFTSPYFGAIAGGMLLANFMGVVIYIHMAQLVSEVFPETDQQTQVFARLDAASNLLSFVGQFLLVRLSVGKLGVGWTLSLLPIVSLVGFAVLAANPVFAVLAGLQVLRRSIGFGLSKPTNDMLYAVVSPEEKYKAKSFIDTAVWRGSDLIAAWSVRLLGGALGLSGFALVCLPLAILWVSLTSWLGRQYVRKDLALSADTP
jgi:AAA family ATP:ADP antiporter